MVGKRLLRTVLFAGALIGGMFVASGAAPAFAGDQNHDPANNNRNFNQERSYAKGSSRDYNRGRYQRSDARNDRHDRDRDHDRGHDRDRDRDRDRNRR